MAARAVNSRTAAHLTFSRYVNMSNSMTERTTVRLPEELLRHAKRQAAAQGRTLTSLIEEGLRQILAKKLGTHTAKRKLPRVSTARGELMPGIDLDDFSSIQQADDLAYVERMKRFT